MVTILIKCMNYWELHKYINEIPLIELIEHTKTILHPKTKMRSHL